MQQLAWRDSTELNTGHGFRLALQGSLFHYKGDKIQNIHNILLPCYPFFSVNCRMIVCTVLSMPFTTFPQLHSGGTGIFNPCNIFT